jgi:uncharacterized membrane protein (DUF2068 family)
VKPPWRDWDLETLACAFRGHCTPATDARLLDDGRTVARCWRCEAWIAATPDRLIPPPDPPPRRGRALRDAIVLRLIAVNRGVHCVLFAMIAVALFVLTLRLPRLQSFATSLNRDLGRLATQAGPNESRSFVVRQLHKVLDLDPHSLHVLAATATAYSVVEGVEAVGLWFERRWAEYLTVLATAGFLPFEVHELTRRVTVVRVGALVVNIAVLVWLVWTKRLFGLRGGADVEHAEEEAARAPVA